MILLFADSILMILITLALGIFARELLSRLFRTPLHTDLLELFLLGLLFSSIYFNLLSFWLPIDYRTLIPLAILTIVVTFKYRSQTRAVVHSIRDNCRLFISRRFWPFIALVGIVLFTYWILPLQSYDSLIYHYESVHWYEAFKVVPGLANLNGRLGFNPAPFLIESAYAFSVPVGQALYPLNGIVAFLLYAWLLLRALRAERAVPALLYGLLLILIYRITLVYINSPTPGVVQNACMCYTLIRLTENSLAGRKSLADNAIPVVIILYAIIVKPATFALLLALPWLFFSLPKTQRTPALLLRTAFLALLIFLPWLVRNYILTGYLVFPFSLTGWFHPDWKVPADIVKMEIFIINKIPKIEFNSSPQALAQAATPFGWFPNWVQTSLHIRPADIFNLFLALLSPLYWLIRFIRRKGPAPLLAPWALAFIATLAWLQACPSFRFGSIYVYCSFLLPAFDAFYTFFYPYQKTPASVPPTPRARWYPATMLLAMALSAVVYIYKEAARVKIYRVDLTACWLKPFRPIDYNDREKMSFPYRILRNGTKMYMADDDHQCINTCLPCQQFNYGRVEMRGTRLDQGFRSLVDEVRLNYAEFLR